MKRNATLNAGEASTLSTFAQYLKLGSGDLPEDYQDLLETLGPEARRIADALVRLTKAKPADRSKAADEYEEAAFDFLEWVETNKSYMKAR